MCESDIFVAVVREAVKNAGNQATGVKGNIGGNAINVK